MNAECVEHTMRFKNVQRFMRCHEKKQFAACHPQLVWPTWLLAPDSGVQSEAWHFKKLSAVVLITCSPSLPLSPLHNLLKFLVMVKVNMCGRFHAL